MSQLKSRKVDNFNITYAYLYVIIYATLIQRYNTKSTLGYFGLPKTSSWETFIYEFHSIWKRPFLISKVKITIVFLRFNSTDLAVLVSNYICMFYPKYTVDLNKHK